MPRKASFYLLVLIVVASVACADVKPSAGLHANAVVDEHIDVDPILADEATGLTAELIRAQSPKRVVEILANRLQEAGIDVVTKDDTLVAALRAKDRVAHAKPMLLFGRADTAPVDDGWTKPPYEGAIEGGSLVGRGALDALSLDALDALTLIALKRNEAPIARDVVFAIGGATLANDDVKRAAYALSEGGFVVESALRPGEDLVEVDVAEKGVFRFALTAHADSEPAAERIVRATDRVLAWIAAEKERVTSPAARELDDVGRAHGGLEALVPSWFARSALDVALVRDTCALTQLRAGQRADVVPSTATATLDCRLLPGTDPHAFRDAVLTAVDDPRVDVRVLDAWPSSSSDENGVVVDAIRARMKSEEPGAPVIAALAADDTACRVVRAASVACYGFTPIRVTKAERASWRGRDERVRTLELERALARLVDVVAALAR